ncbi:hypothetical protein NOCA2220090 [metagenome]|uniref:Uncharacterized protein n=1 Tax=metagenome TaxID=256318 RepID=A0A2P2BYR5_9ZZZZ
MDLPPDALLERREGGEQLGVRACGHPELEGGGEHGAEEVLDHHVQHGPGAVRAARQRARRSRQLTTPDLAEVLDRGQHQRVLGREVVQLGASADSCALRDQGGGRAAPPPLDQALDGGLQQPGTHRPGAFLLRDPDRRHEPQDAGAGNKQSSLTFNDSHARSKAITDGADKGIYYPILSGALIGQVDGSGELTFAGIPDDEETAFLRGIHTLDALRAAAAAQNAPAPFPSLPTGKGTDVPAHDRDS